jgi:hypothetical protein
LIRVLTILIAALLLGACGDDDDPMTDCAGGKYDSTTELCWQDPPAENKLYRSAASEYCNELEIEGHSDWRLPEIGELISLFRGCDLPDDSDVAFHLLEWGGCEWYQGPGAGGCYWSEELHGTCEGGCYQSKTDYGPGIQSFVACFESAETLNYENGFPSYVRCVRDGQ